MIVSRYTGNDHLCINLYLLFLNRSIVFIMLNEWYNEDNCMGTRSTSFPMEAIA